MSDIHPEVPEVPLRQITVNGHDLTDAVRSVTFTEDTEFGPTVHFRATTPPPARFTIVDRRTGRRATIVNFNTPDQAQARINQARRNVERGHRPDLADIIDFLVPAPWPPPADMPSTGGASV